MTGFGDPDVSCIVSLASPRRVGWGEGEGATPSTRNPTTFTMGGTFLLMESDRRLSMALVFLFSYQDIEASVLAQGSAST